MAICDDLVAVVTPKHIKCFAFSCDDGGKLSASQISEVSLSYSVGFADARFIEDATPPHPLNDLRVCIAGQNGLYLLHFSVDELRSRHLKPNPSCIFSQPLPSGINLYLASDTAVTFRPLIDACGTMSWFEGINEGDDSEEPLSFRTISHAMNARHGQHGEPPTPLIFRNSELPALYAMGVRDYDPGLGLAVFGNYFGELVLYNLGRSNISKITSCFGPLERNGPPPKYAAQQVRSSMRRFLLQHPPDTPTALRPNHIWLTLSVLRAFGTFT